MAIEALLEEVPPTALPVAGPSGARLMANETRGEFVVD